MVGLLLAAAGLIGVGLYFRTEISQGINFAENLVIKPAFGSVQWPKYGLTTLRLNLTAKVYNYTGFALSLGRVRLYFYMRPGGPAEEKKPEDQRPWSDLGLSSYVIEKWDFAKDEVKNNVQIPVDIDLTSVPAIFTSKDTEFKIVAKFIFKGVETSFPTILKLSDYLPIDTIKNIWDQAKKLLGFKGALGNILPEGADFNHLLS